MKKFSSLLFVLLLMLASFTAGLEYPRGDVDQDGVVGIGDVTCLVDYLLNGTWDTPAGEHECVDLGLPSGTLWATCNVGAEIPEESGYYFAWGETEPKSVHLWSTYEWCNGNNETMTKYCTVDNKTELDPEDDAAYVNWGPFWRMPTLDQLQELYDNCSWTWTNQNGWNGRLVTGPNGNSIFLPAAGCRWNERILSQSFYGYYWSRTLATNDSTAYDLSIDSKVVGCFGDRRRFGFSVRAVRVSED